MYLSLPLSRVVFSTAFDPRSHSYILINGKTGSHFAAMDPDEEMRTNFDLAVAALLRRKREDNKAFLSADEYECRLREVKRVRLMLRTAGEKKTVKDYRMVRKYTVTVDADGRELLVKPATGTPYVTNEQLFDVLHKAHLDIGHGGRNRMVAVLKTRYSNVTKEAVMTYLKLCARCVRSNPSTAASFKPASKACPTSAAVTAVGRDRVSRARIELIDMQERAYDEYRFVVRHRDHATMFVHLIALRSIRPEEVALGLLDVYAAFGVPAVLESLCGREYVCSVIEHIRSVWDWARIEYAEPELRGRGKSGDREHVIKMLDVWEEANSCDNWPMALRHVQLQKNCEVHPGKRFVQTRVYYK